MIQTIRAENKISNSFVFTFENGEHTGEKYEVFLNVSCKNPLCNCSDLVISVINADDEKIKYLFALDVKNKRLEKSGWNNNLSESNFNFAKSFIKELNEINWKDFYSYLYSFKNEITESCNVDELTFEFNYHEIEENNDMIGYAEVFPFLKYLEIIYKEKKIFIDEQYCLNSKCACHHAVLTMIEFDGELHKLKDSSFALLFDYKNRNIKKLDNNGVTYNPDEINEICELIKTMPDISNILRKRHEKLRKMYKNFRIKKNLNDIVVNNTGKIGRNDPCSCGSGKKYKKCCGI
jgi:uncharacterized protein YecA (UPF0149 family)